MSLRLALAAASALVLLAAERVAAACPAYGACINDAYAEYGELTQRAEEHFTSCIHDPEQKYEDCERSRDCV